MQLEDLLRKPLWQMTGEEFLFLQNSSLQGANYVPAPVAETSKKRYEYGIRGIAKIFGCSIPTANRIKKSGKINVAKTEHSHPLGMVVSTHFRCGKGVKRGLKNGALPFNID